MELSNNHATHSEQHDSHSWPALMARLIADLTKVLEAEARLLRASIEPTMTAVLNRWLLQLIVASIAVTGGMLLLCAGVLLLHKWVEWWLAFGIAGAATVAAAFGSLMGRG
jgi:hypothetical protein